MPWSLITKNEANRMPEAKVEHTHDDPDDLILNHLKIALTGLTLSPRGVVGKPSHHGNSKILFSCCLTCHNHLKAKEPTTPFCAVMNNNFIGCALSVLTELTEAELALIQPVLKHGCCFTCSGGQVTNLKGAMSFFRVEERKVASGSVQVEQMGLNNNIVILLTVRQNDQQTTTKGNRKRKWHSNGKMHCRFGMVSRKSSKVEKTLTQTNFAMNLLGKHRSQWTIPKKLNQRMQT